MPTIEFHGYDDERAEGLVDAARPHLARLPYCGDIVFHTLATGNRVWGWDGRDRPFVRIASRSATRLDELSRVFLPLTDVETFLIGFMEKGGRECRG